MPWRLAFSFSGLEWRRIVSLPQISERGDLLLRVSTMNQSTQQQVLLQREGKPSFESPVSLVSRRGEGRAFESRIATQWMGSMCAPKDGRVLTSWGSSFLHTRTRFGETTPVPQRRRIAVLVSPKMTELGRWKTDFVRARLDFFSQDYVPAVLGVPASSLEGRLTRDLLSTFSSGFTTNEETITTLVGCKSCVRLLS